MTRLSEFADVIPGLTVVRDCEFESLGNLSDTTPRRLVFAEDAHWSAQALNTPDVAALITTPDLAASGWSATSLGIATTESPRHAFFAIHNHLARHTDFYRASFENRIDPSARIHPSAVLADRGVQIGANVLIEPSVTIFGPVEIGDHSIIRTGTRIGTQGFEFKRIGALIFGVEHAGGVRIGQNVEIQANCTVDRSVFAKWTTIGNDSKLDNMVHVAHNVVVGERCMVAAQAMLAGSVTLGDDVWIGPSSAISSGVTIGNGASVTIGAVVTRDVPPNSRVSGNFAVEHEKLIAFLRTIR